MVNDIATSMKTAGKRQYTKLSSSDWDALIRIYSCGGATLFELSATHGVSVSAIMSHARARGATRRGTLPPAAAVRAVSSTAKTASGITTGIVPRSLATTEDKIRETNEAAYADATAIQNLLRIALAALPAPASPAELSAVVRCADQAANTLDRCNKIRRQVLRMDRENNAADAMLPELPIIEMTQLETEAMRAQQAREDRELGVEVSHADQLPEQDEDDHGVIDVNGGDQHAGDCAGRLPGSTPE